MVIGIKYCGGCNPRYQRAKAVEKLKEKFPEHTYVSTGYGKECDIWIVVCGCSRACADHGGLMAGKKKFLAVRERSFEEIGTYLKEERKQIEKAKGKPCGKETGGRQKKILHLGDTAEIIRTFYQDDGEKFADVTGDRNPLHFDGSFTADHWFRRPVVHGALIGGMFSAVMGMKLPGPGTILSKEQIWYRLPVNYGDTICARILLKEVTERKSCYIGTFQGTCRNQRNEIVAEALFTQIMMKTMFTLK